MPYQTAPPCPPIQGGRKRGRPENLVAPCRKTSGLRSKFRRQYNAFSGEKKESKEKQP